MYSENEINRVLKEYDETAFITATIVELGYSSRCNLYRWVKNRNLPQKVAIIIKKPLTEKLINIVIFENE